MIEEVPQATYTRPWNVACPDYIGREQLIAQARTWLGTPFFHAGREKGIGVDCTGFVIGVASEIGLFTCAERNYPHIVPESMTRAYLERYCTPIPKEAAQIGDLFLFNIMGHAQHVGFLAARGPENGAPAAWTLLHACGIVGKVVEHDLTASWDRRIDGAWCIKGYDAEAAAWPVWR